MDVDADTTDYVERRQALNTVLWWFKDVEPAPAWNDLLGLAQDTYDYLTASKAVYLVLRVGPVCDQDTGLPSKKQPKPKPGGGMQLKDNQQVGYTLQALDAKGYPVTESNFDASSSDDSVVTVNDSGDNDSGTWLAVAGVPGSAVLTFTDGTLSVTEAIDVVPGDAATIQVTPGTPENQPGNTDGGGTGGGGGDGTGGDTGDGGVTPGV